MKLNHFQLSELLIAADSSPQFSDSYGEEGVGRGILFTCIAGVTA